mmetsp:Transcript_13726/g.22715  ORF Transcript_13726/g.22715 Transcript_13726/m.22715 type:complete len:327 (-) Transcript_13726:2895-3875(-)
MASLSHFWKKHRNRVGLAYFASGLAMGLVCSYIMTASQGTSTRSRSTTTRNLLKSNNDNGWKSVNVFFGDSKHIRDYSSISKDYFEQVQWYSQARQDEVVAALLQNKKGGYFIDLASNDPVKISNTYALETKLGWRGLCMEPNPLYWAGLSYRTCDIVGAVVGSNRMEEIQFRFPNRVGPQGGIVGDKFDNKEASKFGEDKPRYTVTLLEIFERFQTPSVIDYLSLDVEGAEEFVMKGFPFDKYRFNIITLERPNDALKEMLTTNGYQFLRLLKANSGDTLWIHKSMVGKLDVKASCKIDTMKKYLEQPTARVPADDQGKDYFCEE